MSFLFACTVHWGMNERSANMYHIGSPSLRVCSRFAYVQVQFNLNNFSHILFCGCFFDAYCSNVVYFLFYLLINAGLRMDSIYNNYQCTFPNVCHFVVDCEQ